MKSNLDKHFKTNPEFEKNGVWFELDDKIGFLLKPLNRGNPSVKAAFAKEYKPYARQIELGTLDEDTSLRIQIRLFIKSCMVDWKGIEMDGKATEYSADAAEILFTELPDLFTTLWNHVQDFKNYRDDVGNS